jgi:hypothetical protein
MSNKKVCEHSLRWILNYRYFGKDFVINRDGANSGYSYSWVLSQSKYIDQYGLENWLNTNNALGYNNYVENLFNNKIMKYKLKDFYNKYKSDNVVSNKNTESYEEFLEYILKNSDLKNKVDANGYISLKI